MTWFFELMYLKATALYPWTVVLAQTGPGVDPTGGWITVFSGLGVASILVGYMGFDNSRLRKELKEKDAKIETQDQERAKLLNDMITRYERLIPVETESQRLHMENARVLERTMTMMHQLAARPTLTPEVIEMIRRGQQPPPTGLHPGGGI